MGRWAYSSRNTVEDSKAIDVFFLKSNGYLSGYKGGQVTWKVRDNITGSVGIFVTIEGERGLMRLVYSKTDTWTKRKEDFNYSVDLEKTTCNYGGIRWWFLCPILGCGKRVAKLYLPPGAKYFGCRSCYKLTYESCRESHSWAYRFAKAHGATLGQLKKSLRE